MADAVTRFILSCECFLLLRALFVKCSPLDEHIVGEPEVECGPERIGIRIFTDEPFHGTLYMQNRRHKDECRTANYSVDAARSSLPFARLSIPLNDLATCGLELKRHRENGNLVIRGVWIFSFHPMFVTKVDRAFDVQCVFRQRDITSQFEMTVSDLIPLAIRRTFVLPFVEMKIVNGSVADPTLPPLSKSKVGDKITFIWHAPDSSSVLNIHVKECLAESKRGVSINVIQNGCRSESVMSSDVEQSADGRIVFATATTFKFPDEEDIWFRCRLILCSKIQHAGRTFISDSCPEVENCTNGKRAKRSASIDSSLAGDLMESDYDMHVRVIDAYNQRKTGFMETASDRVSLFNSDSTKYRKGGSSSFRLCVDKWIFAWSVLNACGLSGMISACIVKRYRGGQSLPK